MGDISNIDISSAVSHGQIRDAVAMLADICRHTWANVIICGRSLEYGIPRRRLCP